MVEGGRGGPQECQQACSGKEEGFREVGGQGGGGWRNQLGQAGGLGVGEREEGGSRSNQTLRARVTYKGAEGTRRHTQDSGQETRPHWREVTVRAWCWL